MSKDANGDRPSLGLRFKPDSCDVTWFDGHVHPAAQGITPGSTVTAVNGYPVANRDELDAVLANVETIKSVTWERRAHPQSPAVAANAAGLDPQTLKVGSSSSPAAQAEKRATTTVSTSDGGSSMHSASNSPANSALRDQTAGAGWYPDPLGRLDFRYYDGTDWTSAASANGKVVTDPLPKAATERNVEVAALRFDSRIAGQGATARALPAQSTSNPSNNGNLAVWWSLGGAAVIAGIVLMAIFVSVLNHDGSSSSGGAGTGAIPMTRFEQLAYDDCYASARGMARNGYVPGSAQYWNFADEVWGLSSPPNYPKNDDTHNACAQAYHDYAAHPS